MLIGGGISRNACSFLLRTKSLRSLRPTQDGSISIRGVLRFWISIGETRTKSIGSALLPQLIHCVHARHDVRHEQSFRSRTSNGQRSEISVSAWEPKIRRRDRRSGIAQRNVLCSTQAIARARRLSFWLAPYHALDACISADEVMIHRS